MVMPVLKHQRQRVKLGSSLSDLTLITGGMPQGPGFMAWTSNFYRILNDIHPSCTIHKFMDNVTLTGSDLADTCSNMAHYISHL